MWSPWDDWVNRGWCLRSVVSPSLVSMILSDGNGIRTYNHLVRKQTLSLAKWLSVRLRNRWLWVRIPLPLLKLQVLRLFQARRSLTLRQLYGWIHSETCQSLNSRWCLKSPGLALEKIFLMSDEFLFVIRGRRQKKCYSEKWLIESCSWQNKVSCQVGYFCVFCEKLVLSKKLWSILTKLLTSVRRSLLGKEQWRKKNE